MKELSRRELLTQTAGMAGAATMGLPLVGATELPQTGDATPAHKLKVVVAGAHPDKVVRAISSRRISSLNWPSFSWMG